jgi:GNAT superfamily N-acetyltransferase
MDSAPVIIKRLTTDSSAQAPDWRAISALCCRTGNDGREIDRNRWDFFARLWVEPYERLCPEWSYVAAAGDVIVGYLTGCPDSRAFARSKYWRITLPLLLDIARGRYSYFTNRDSRVFVRRFCRFEKWPEQVFSREIQAAIRRTYPAHLHMNVAAAGRRTGIGTKLIDRYLADLHGAGVRGVHLHCGAGPLQFYRRRGFEQLGSILFHGAQVYALGRSVGD